MLSVRELMVILTSTFDHVKSILLVSNVLFFLNPSVSVDEKNRLVTWNWGGGYPKWRFIRAVLNLCTSSPTTAGTAWAHRHLEGSLGIRIAVLALEFETQELKNRTCGNRKE